LSRTPFAAAYIVQRQLRTQALRHTALSQLQTLTERLYLPTPAKTFNSF